MTARMIRPSDIESAAAWYTGADVGYDAPRFQRNVQAKRIMWAAMREIGMSYPEIGRFTGHDHTTIVHSLKKNASVPQCFIDGVLERARSEVAEECGEPPVVTPLVRMRKFHHANRLETK